MNQGRADSPDQVTVLVFKDNYSARTFHIPFNWLTRFGFILGVFSLITVTAIFLAFRFYRVAQISSPERMYELENQIEKLKTTNRDLEIKVSQAPPVPVPVEEAPQETPVASTPSSGVRGGMFTVLPAGKETALKDPSSLPIQLVNSQVRWQGRTLLVRFGVQYIRETGHQQGRIVILARGPNTLRAHPETVLNPAGSDSLIEPLRGEFFSVTRFRDTRAEFTGTSPRDIKDVEVLVFDADGDLMLMERFTPEAPPTAAPKATPRPAVQAKPTSAPIQAEPATSTIQPSATQAEPAAPSAPAPQDPVPSEPINATEASP